MEFVMKKILLISSLFILLSAESQTQTCQDTATIPNDCIKCNNPGDNYDACLQATSCQAVAKKFSDCNMCNYTNRNKYDNHDACMNKFSS